MRRQLTDPRQFLILENVDFELASVADRHTKSENNPPSSQLINRRLTHC